MPIDLVVETTQLLIKACQLNQDFDEAEGFRHWLHEVTSQNSNDIASKSPDLSQEQQQRIGDPLLDSAMVDVLNWCKSAGFNVDSPSFRFEGLNKDGKTPLHVAVKKENLAIVSHIAEHVQTLETPDRERGATALWVAAETRNRRTTEVLLRKGAKVAVTDRWGNTPLHAVQSAKGGIAVAKLLLDFPNTNTSPSRHYAEFSPSASAPLGLGISAAPPSIAIDGKNSYEKTALHIACEMGNDAMVQFLLERGADLSSQGPAGCTPLHSAVYARRISIVKLLLDRGADTAIRDNRGYDALNAAKKAEMQSQDIIRMIQEVDNRGHSPSLRRGSHTSKITKEVGSPNSSERRSIVSTGTGEWGATRRETSTTLVESEDVGRKSISEISNVSSRFLGLGLGSRSVRTGEKGGSNSIAGKIGIRLGRER
jgi:ankyrin repeat protein